MFYLHILKCTDPGLLDCSGRVRDIYVTFGGMKVLRER